MRKCKVAEDENKGKRVKKFKFSNKFKTKSNNDIRVRICYMESLYTTLYALLLLLLFSIQYSIDTQYIENMTMKSI